MFLDITVYYCFYSRITDVSHKKKNILELYFSVSDCLIVKL